MVAIYICESKSIILVSTNNITEIVFICVTYFNSQTNVTPTVIYIRNENKVEMWQWQASLLRVSMMYEC